MPYPSRIQRLPTLSALVSSIILLASAAPVSADSESSAASKPDLICHTNDPQDCYPRIFEATHDFQKVHHDQELPHGLHVRLNINTGEKEAKINVPGEADASLEGLPVEHDVVVVEPKAPEVPIIPKGAPGYKEAGKIKGPEQESKAFIEGMSLLRGGKGDEDPGFDNAIEGVEDLSHDLYYGLKVAEDTDVVKALLCRMSHVDEKHAEGFPPRDQQAAAILAGSLQNNPTALAEVAQAWTDIMDHRCPTDQKPLRNTFFQSIAPQPASSAAERRAAAGRIKVKVAALNGLIKEPVIRSEFLRHDGMRELLRVLVNEDKEWAMAQRRIGHFVADNFLDKNMGATVGLWPTGPRLSDEQCKKEEWRTAEGCWDYSVDRIARANKGDKEHWSKDLQTRLATARKNNKKAPHPEL